MRNYKHSRDQQSVSGRRGKSESGVSVPLHPLLVLPYYTPIALLGDFKRMVLDKRAETLNSFLSFFHFTTLSLISAIPFKSTPYTLQSNAIPLESCRPL